MTESAAFHEEFPVLEHVAYLNAGTNGPVPRRAAEAAEHRLREETERGRAGHAHWETLAALRDEIRQRLARLAGCSPEDLALTRSTTDGMATVLSALDLKPGDDVLTSDEEHPGLLAPLAAAARRTGCEVRFVPFAALGSQVREDTRLVACSHVSWISGQVADTRALAESPALVVLDGAQGLGAVPVDVGELGCDFYAASGQKWLCGPEGSGCLYARRDLCDELPAPWPNYASLADPQDAFGLDLHPGARRFDMGVLPGVAACWWRASLELLAHAGWDWIHECAAARADALAERLRERGADVVERGRSTLVAWRSPDPEAEVERLAQEGVVVRDLPGRGLVRASVGAWSSEAELERLTDLVRAGTPTP